MCQDNTVLERSKSSDFINIDVFRMACRWYIQCTKKVTVHAAIDPAKTNSEKKNSTPKTEVGKKLIDS